MSEIVKLVITGASRSGKTSAINFLKTELAKLGYYVAVIDNISAELAEKGISPQTVKPADDFYKCFLQAQLERENICEAALSGVNAKKKIIICDGGTADIKAYISENKFSDILESVKLSEIDLKDTYSAVFCLLSNEKDTSAADDKIISSWVGHSHMRIIKSTEAFDEKLSKLLFEVKFFLGEPEPLEIERKLLIEYPDISWLKKNPFCCAAEIEQAYLKDENGENLRIRKRGASGSFIYIETRKQDIDGIKRIEIENRISEDRYITMIKNAGDQKNIIKKTRYCLVYDSMYFEIDVFPFWNDKAFMEIELSDENQKFSIPPEIHVIKDVSDDKSYRNSSLARIYGDYFKTERKTK